jgi:hypothetical protein
MLGDWRKVERGLFESADGQWRITNPWKLMTGLRHRWRVAERRCSGSGWNLHDGDHPTLHDAARMSRAQRAALGRAVQILQAKAFARGASWGYRSSLAA